MSGLDRLPVTESSQEHYGHTFALCPVPPAPHADPSENPGRRTTLRLRYAGEEEWKKEKDRKGEAAGRQDAK